jgi:copper homeostasis protein
VQDYLRLISDLSTAQIQYTRNLKSSKAMPSLEIACFNAESALRAHRAGADRIELCADQSVGGLTPSLNLFKSLRADISTPINVMIRPRGPGFACSAADLVQMEGNVSAFARAGADGFVFGGLTAEGKVDEQSMRKLVSRAEGRPCTFHRAFDAVREADMDEALETIVALGFRALLTSGGAADAVQGREQVRRLVERAAGRIEVIVGGGVRSGNVEQLQGTGARWFHSSGIVDGGEEASAEEVQALRRALDA